MPSKKQQSDGDGSVFQLKNGKWRAVVSLGFDAKGKRIRKTKTAKSKAEAIALRRTMLADKAAGQLVSPSKITVAEFLERWLNDAVRGQVAPNTVLSYQNLCKPLVQYLGRVKLVTLTSQQIDAAFAEMLRDGKGSRTRSSAFVILSTALKRACKWRLLLGNPCTGATKPRHKTKTMNPLSLEEAKLVLRLAATHRLYALILLAVSHGLRKGELFGLTPQDLDLPNRRLHIRQQVVHIRGQPASLDRPKTPSSIRTIELTDECVAALMYHRTQSAKEGFFAPTTVFHSLTGGFLHPANFDHDVWAPLLKRAGLAYRPFHNLRHTCASLLLCAGVPVHVVAGMLGHSNPATTLKVYSHILASAGKTAPQAMSRLLG